MYNNYQTQESEMPYLLPSYETAPYGNTGMAPTNRKLTRTEKRAIKKQQKDANKAQKQANKLAKKNKGTNIGGAYIAPVAPREEFFMGQQPINEVQKPGVASGHGIPSMGAHNLGHQGLPTSTYGSSMPTGYSSQYANTGSYSTQNYTSSHIGQGSPRVIYESAIPTTSTYTTSSLGGSHYTSSMPQTTTTTKHIEIIEQQPMMQQQQFIQQQPMMSQQQQYARPVQVQGYYDGMLLEQPHEKAGGFFAPFTGSFSNHGAGTTRGLQGQGKANMANTIASQLPFTGGAGGLPGQGGYGNNPLLNAPNLTYPVALEGERMKGLNNQHIGLGAPLAGTTGMPANGQKLSRKERRAQKKALKNGQINPEYNNAAVY